MKICYVNKGVSPHDHKMIRYLLGRGYQVHLISYHGGDIIDDPGLTVHHLRIPTGPLSFLAGCLLTPFLIRRIRPDVVLAHNLLTYGFFSVLARYHPVIVGSWGSDILLLPDKNPIFRAIIKYTLRQADQIAVVSHTCRRACIDKGCPNEKISVFYHGVDFQKFNPDIDGRDVRAKLGWADNPVVICTRFLEPVYGMEYLLQAVPLVLREHPGARFLLVGSGSLEASLKGLARKLGIENCVHFAGRVPNDQIGQYLAASDMCVSSSLSDGTPTSLMEAMACALPLIVTDVVSVGELVQDGNNGLVVPKRDPEAMARAICRLLADKELRDRFSRKNEELAAQKVSYESNMKVLENMFRMAGCVDESGSASPPGKVKPAKGKTTGK